MKCCEGNDDAESFQRADVCFHFFIIAIFLGQANEEDKCFLFKMSTKGQGLGVDWVNRMNHSREGYPKDSWIHFDYTHRVKGWAIMSCFVYDPR